jgi:hypothetical protein
MSSIRAHRYAQQVHKKHQIVERKIEYVYHNFPKVYLTKFESTYEITYEGLLPITNFLGKNNYLKMMGIGI